MSIPEHKADSVLWNPGRGRKALHANWSSDSWSLLPLQGDDTAGLVFLHSLCLFMTYTHAINALALRIQEEDSGFILASLTCYVPYSRVVGMFLNVM